MERWPETSVREELLDLLNEIPRWRLPDDRWDRTDQYLRALDDALAARDIAELDAAAAGVELCCARRVTRLGEPSTVPPPEPVLERVNQLIHALEPTAPETPEDPLPEPPPVPS
ncbi:CATRA system-associated protein [Actinomadura sp. NEAU-AAG7]|uniref:CATRA system-associated protein n=1 Tax=Actinomadura sp. NEAU-AAG7 TaxID=2839640 RepID=UPI001BE3E44A|nr:CATRA system-associated protein [Actinomadura sp. NEAU-AAG7]MBT2207779.1 hypothetical protein [Actinomadura sp. NEAU-AAG7]